MNSFSDNGKSSESGEHGSIASLESTANGLQALLQEESPVIADKKVSNSIQFAANILAREGEHDGIIEARAVKKISRALNAASRRLSNV